MVLSFYLYRISNNKSLIAFKKYLALSPLIYIAILLVWLSICRFFLAPDIFANIVGGFQLWLVACAYALIIGYLYVGLVFFMHSILTRWGLVQNNELK